MTTPTSQPQSQTTTPSARDIISNGIDNNSISQVRQGLDLFAQSRRGLDSFSLDWALSLAVKRAQPDLVRYLLDETDAKVEGLSPLKVGIAARDQNIKVGKVEEVLEVLVERGWDVNGSEASGSTALHGGYLLYQICHSEPLVRWCLSHGAHTSYPDSDQNYNPPLSEIIAQQGTVSILKLVLEHGAQLGRRTLHRAVESAAYADSERRAERMEMVRFLVDELRVDVNAIDVPEGKKYPNHWGTPMAYAVIAKDGQGDGGEEVVRFLLDKGADPEIEDCWELFNVYTLAERLKNGKISRVLSEWKTQKQEVEA